MLVSLLTAVLTTIGVSLLRHWAPRLGLLDIPNERSSHTVPTPRGGGLAIVIVALIGLPALALYRGVFSAGIVLTYLIAGAIIAAVGWIDDRRSLSARLRLTPQIAVAVITIIGMGFVADVRPPLVPPVLTGGIAGIVHWGWLGLPLTLLWIVGLINAYNFMDGIDGLAAGQAVIGGVFWMIVGWQIGAELPLWLGLLIASASFGFLLHNWPPARIFMGDVASGFLGFSFAVLPLLAAQTGKEEGRALIAGASFVGVFIFDAGLTFLRRLLRGENVLEAHRSHLYQRLVKKGYSHRAVTTLYLILATLCGGCGLVYWVAGQAASALALVLALVVMLALFFGVARVERE